MSDRLVPPPRPFVLPLSFAQRRVWFFDRLLPDPSEHVVRLGFELEGRLEETALERALAEIVRRHEVLRTTITSLAGEPVQAVGKPFQPPLERHDLTGLGGPERRAAAERLAAELLTRPMSPASGPLLRVLLLRTAPARHVVLLALHHAIADARSMRLFEGELRTLLEAFGEARPSPLPELPLQYADHALLERDRLEGAERDGLAAHWRRRLGGASGVLELPSRGPRPHAATFAAGRESVALDRSLAAGVERLAARVGVEPAAVLLTAFAATLARHAGEQDVLVGWPVDGRDHPDLATLIGCFVDLAVVRVDLSGRPTFAAAVARTGAGMRDALAHRGLPFELVLDALDLQRDPLRPPLVQVAFVFESEPSRDPPELPATALPLAARGHGPGFYDLALAFRSGSDRGLEGTLHYSRDVYDAAAAAAFGGHVRTLLAAGLASPNEPVDRLPVLTTAERGRLLGEWNASDRPFARERRVHELFEDQADRTPEAIALDAGDRQLSYAQLDRRANQVAAYLRRSGVGPESLVALCVDRSPELVTAILGTLKAGGAYVPLDPGYPPDRLAGMISDAGPRVLLTRRGLLRDLPGPAGAQVEVLDDDSPVWREDGARVRAPGGPANLAYLVFTSGSTGRPKAVELPHEGLTNLVEDMRRLFRLAPGRRVLQFASPSFDAAAFELFPALASGATMVIAPASSLLPGPDLVRVCREAGVTDLVAAPSVLMALRPADLPTLRLVVSAGEACPSEVVERWAAGRELFNGYGPSEVTIAVSFARLRPGEVPPPIGRPMANKRAYVLNDALEPLPPGVPGELWVGGVGLARGYRGQPGMTAGRFLPDPFAGGPGARMYRTGDVVRHRDDGAMVFVGRADDQVKVRGYRIEPGEIRSVLLRHPSVARCVVGLRDYSPTDRRLVAWVVPAGAGLAIDDLRSWARTQLPAYMVPSAFVPVGDIPLTPNGKVNWPALPLPTTGPAAGLRPLTTPTQSALARIWRDVLVLDRELGAQDDFFDLGGHSLVAMQVVARVQADLGVQVPLRTLFESPVLETFAERVERLRESGADS